VSDRRACVLWGEATDIANIEVVTTDDEGLYKCVEGTDNASIWDLTPLDFLFPYKC
jgi:hypothetical protein